MPEGDSIWRAAAELNQALAGQVLTASDFRVPRFATLDLSGWTVGEVVPRGKHLLMRLFAPGDDGERTGSGTNNDESGPRITKRLTIHSHLKMEGSWQIYPPGGRWNKPGHTARCILRTAGTDVVGFSLGILEVIPTANEESVLGHLGPDILGPDWDAAEATARILAALAVPIGVALLDQRNVAGIGNIYRCETCFIAGVHPAVPVSGVPDVPLMLDDAKRLLEANLGPGRRATIGVELAPGPAAADPTASPSRGPTAAGTKASLAVRPADPSPNRTRRATLLATGRAAGRDAAIVGRFPGGPARRTGPGSPGACWVYGRERQACLLCGATIRRGVLGPASGMEDRDIFFCPVCQPLP